jgi:MYXO-CTERM domain-containing protein
MIRTWCTAPVWAAAVLLAPTAMASIAFSGDVGGSTEATGSTYSGSLEYAYIGGSVGELTITISNDTPALIGGHLTSIVFRFDSLDDAASALLTSSSVAGMTDTGSVNAAPFGTFMGGAGTGGQFEGGGSPANGLAIGATATFVWTINASDAGSLSDLSFANAAHQPSLLVRFRGLADGGSDKVPGTFVPAPASAALVAFAGLFASRRRR